MAVPSSVMKYRLDIASDLLQLRNILWNKFPNGDFSSIDIAITELRDKESIPQLENKDSYPELWGYQSTDILFRFESSPEKSKPHPIKEVELIFAIKIRGNTGHIDTLNDPLDELKFDIIIRGKHQENKVISSYHLDRHIFKEGDNESVEPHPLYHFQFGGNKMIDEIGEGIDTGNTMFLDAPRVPHYPMDLILGIDFIISNFFPVKWRELNESKPEYINLIAKYQNRLINPFLEMFNNHFKSTVLHESNKNWCSTMIKPQLV